MSSSDKLSNDSFDLDRASNWTRRYREQHTDGIKGHLFSRATIEAILAQPNCEGVRVYYGRDEQNKRRLVMVGTDVNDNDLIASSLEQVLSDNSSSTSLSFATDSDNIIIGPGKICPPNCSIQNTLNS